MSTLNAPLTQQSGARERLPSFHDVQSACMKALCVILPRILLILAFITFYLLAKGISYLSWDIFTEVPIPVGMEARRVD
jgi:hypothetical protein